ncbi:hypothetical protein F892_01692 [Acinetobacter vivianii]|uniref:Uncharacterized protein n=1 Tax=Acinetobacter vivianii TaxID=1776742 RepID=N9Q7Q7_9GAMM|nr:hypothetical protein [Acinetobacter vivianii]ENX22450.1 hypothetical protein F892_01692 [Acinetobacter vivianii]GGI58819.1 hypothetical protein GCM10011446_03140 [Acinetobacter vivianii]
MKSIELPFKGLDKEHKKDIKNWLETLGNASYFNSDGDVTVFLLYPSKLNQEDCLHLEETLKNHYKITIYSEFAMWD